MISLPVPPLTTDAKVITSQGRVLEKMVEITAEFDDSIAI